MIEFGITRYKYQHYDEYKWRIFERDFFTCQECGYKTDSVLILLFGCQDLENQYDSEYRIVNRHPIACPHKDEIGEISYKTPLTWYQYGKALIPTIPRKSCFECKYMVCFSFYDHFQKNLVMHHRNSNPYDNRFSNLTTLCDRCNRLSKYRRYKNRE